MNNNGNNKWLIYEPKTKNIYIIFYIVIVIAAIEYIKWK
jgi:hypothetical protein